MQKTSFSILIICMLFSSEVFCQNFYLNIYGDTAYENKVLDSLSYAKTHENYVSIKSEIDSVQNKLYKIGFIENELSAIKKTNDSTFNAHIHLKKLYSDIYIYYDKTLVDRSVINLVSTQVFDTHFVLPIGNIERALILLNSKITEQGFPFSKLKLINTEIKDTNSLKAELSLQSKEIKRYINDIVIKGYEKFPKSYLKHYLKIKPLQTFNIKTIERKTEQLNELKFANQIKAPEILFSTDSTTLYLYLEKTKSNSFDGFLGFGTNKETNKLQFDGYLNLNLVNNLNYGESFRLQYKSDENDQKTFKTDISLPYVFNSPLGIDLQLYIFKRDSSFTTVNQSAKVHYQINSKHKIYTGFTSIESNNLLSGDLQQNISDYNASFYTFAYQFIKTQAYNFLFPINSKFDFETGFGRRKIISASEKQTQISIDAYKILNLNPKNSLYLRVDASYLNSASYFENELLRFGGINSIRGFEENSLLASLYGTLNTEYRFQLNKTIYIHSILDLGYLENKITDIKEKLFGYGLGFAILTKTGLFRFNYANGKNENQTFKLSNSKIHVSLTADF